MLINLIDWNKNLVKSTIQHYISAAPPRRGVALRMVWMLQPSGYLILFLLTLHGCYNRTHLVLYKHRGHALPVVVAKRVHSGRASLPERQTCAPGHARQHVLLVGGVMDVNFPRGFRVAGGVCCKASPNTLKSNHPLTMRILSIHSLVLKPS